jgi:hypothetical protein
MPARVISLTSIPPRFGHLTRTLESVVSQSGGQDEVRLTLPRRYRRFPDWDGVLPTVPPGVRIVRVEEDLGPATKVLPAVAELRGEDGMILFCDDDRLYPPGWARGLFEAQRAMPDRCVAQRGFPLRRIEPTAYRNPRLPHGDPGERRLDLGYRLARLRQQVAHRSLDPPDEKPPRRGMRRGGWVDVLWGYAGAVLRPSFLDAEAFDIPGLLWTVDDVWISGMLERGGVGIWSPGGGLVPRKTAAGSVEPLLDAVLEGASRQRANREAVRYLQERYGIWTAGPSDPRHG